MGNATMPELSRIRQPNESAGPQCPQHGEKFLTAENGFGGWETVTCTKCHRLIVRRKKDE